MKAAHLAAVEWLAKATGAETEGMELKSRNLVFRPSATVFYGSSAVEDDDTGRPSTENHRNPSSSAWKEIRKDGKLIRLESHIRLSTPGSIFLILQALLPYLLFSTTITNRSSPSNPSPIPLRLTLAGGTNVSKSPSYEYTSQVLLPLLSHHLHLPPITSTLHTRGWTNGPTAIGSVTFDITPLAPSTALPPFDLQAKNRGPVVSIAASILAPSTTSIATLKSKLATKLHATYPPTLPVSFPVAEESGHPKRLYLLLVAETAGGYRLGRDWLYDRKAKSYTSDDVLEKLVERVVRELESEVANGGCVDEYMQDQVVVFQALGEGRSGVGGGGGGEGTVEGEEGVPSLHTRTARWVVERVLGRGFDGKGECEGVGLRVGERFLERGPGGEEENRRGGTVEEGIEKLEIR